MTAAALEEADQILASTTRPRYALVGGRLRALAPAPPAPAPPAPVVGVDPSQL